MEQSFLSCTVQIMCMVGIIATVANIWEYKCVRVFCFKVLVVMCACIVYPLGCIYYVHKYNKFWREQVKKRWTGDYKR